MRLFAVGHNVKINPDVPEDPSVKGNHPLFQEALTHTMTGETVEPYPERTNGTDYWFRVTFHFFTAPLKQDHLILFSKEPV